jgi:hypothetical protein
MMTLDHELETLLRSVLRDIPPMPDRVVAEALARLPVMPQRRARWTKPRSAWSPARHRSLALVIVATIVAALLAAWAVVGQQPSAPLTFAPGSIAYTSAGSVYVADPDGGDPVEIAAAQPGEGSTAPIVSFAPDRRHIASMWTGTTGARLVIVAADGRTAGSVSVPNNLEVTPTLLFSWAPDGQRLATYTPDEPGRLTIFGVDATRLGTIALPEGAGGMEVYGAAMLPWSPDGRWIAVRNCTPPSDPAHGPCDGRLGYLLVASDGSGSRPLVAPALADRVETDHQFMAWSPDGRAALNQWYPGRVEILSADGTDIEEVWLPGGLNPEDSTGALAWSPAGDRLAVLERTADQSASQLVVLGDGLAPRVVPRDALDLVQGFKWSGDGQRFIYTATPVDSSQGYGLWSVPVGGGTATRLIDGIDVAFDIADGMP